MTTSFSLPDNTCALLVNDVPSRCAVLHELLSKVGVSDIRQAATRSEMLRELSDAPIDIILLASGCTFDAIQMAREVRASNTRPYIPIILIVDEVDGPQALCARDSGVTDFLPRPFTLLGMTQCLANTVVGNRPRQPASPPISAKPALSKSAKAA